MIASLLLPFTVAHDGVCAVAVAGISGGLLPNAAREVADRAGGRGIVSYR